jgi:hypothetical protein
MRPPFRHLEMSHFTIAHNCGPFGLPSLWKAGTSASRFDGHRPLSTITPALVRLFPELTPVHFADVGQGGAFAFHLSLRTAVGLAQKGILKRLLSFRRAGDYLSGAESRTICRLCPSGNNREYFCKSFQRPLWVSLSTISLICHMVWVIQGF